MSRYATAVDRAREYYDSDDADNFYHTIWGGEDIHIGLYRAAGEPIAEASRRTIEHMAARVSGLGAAARVLDLGAGYGGAARYLARTFGCRVVALNLSAVENARARQLNRAQGLDHRIEVIEASFEDIPFPDASFDCVWSQDAILHSGDRVRVLQEAARVMKPGAELVFTDPMQTDDCPGAVLQPILDRIHLQTLGSPGFYRRTLTGLGLQDLGYEDHTQQLTAHYGRVLAETATREEELARAVSRDYIARMKKGLAHWVEGGESGHLAWGIFHFRKPV